MIKKLKNINKKRIFIILGIIVIVLIFIIIFLRINKNIVKLNEEARTEAESDEINLKIDIKESTTDNYKCLLTFSSNNEVNNIKQIEYPEEEGKDKYIVNIANENGKEKVAIDYSFNINDIDKTFVVVTKNGDRISKKTAYEINFEKNGGINEKITKQYGFVGNYTTLTSEYPVDESKVFLGWSSKKESNHIDYVEGDKYISDKESSTLYAVYETSGGIVKYISTDEVNKSGDYSIERSGVTYNFDVLYLTPENINEYGSYDTNTNTYKIEKNINLGNASEKKMAVLKCDGNLTVNSEVTITTSTYEETSASGVKGNVTKEKGMYIYCSGTLTNNGIISQTARGTYESEGENVYLWSEKSKYGSFYVPKVGANGGARKKDSERK